MNIWKRISTKVRPTWQILAAFASIIVLAAGSIALTRPPSVVAAERTYRVWEHELPSSAIKITRIDNLQSPVFPRDFEIEEQNVSDKPIYFFQIMVLLPDTKALFKRTVGFDLTYGNSRLVDNTKRAQPEDIPVQPGQRFRLKGTPSAGGLRNVIAQGLVPESMVSEALLLCQVLNFGDGTGFIGRSAYSDKKISLNDATSLATRNPQLAKSFTPVSSAVKPVCPGYHVEAAFGCHPANTCLHQIPVNGGPEDTDWCVIVYFCPTEEGDIGCNFIFIYNCNWPVIC